MCPHRSSNRVTLPIPGEAALAVSRQLADRIHREIAAAGGSIPFARFMELALYAPGLGYYSAGSHKFGPQGDFITAPELSPLFGRCLARQCAEVLAYLGEGDVLEFGAGSGVLAAELLASLERLGALPGRYLILELSADLAERQRRTLAERVPHLLPRVEWLRSSPTAFEGVVIANEVLDAMPVQRFRLAARGVDELRVQSADTGFDWFAAAPDARLGERVAQLRSAHGLPEGYESEVGFQAEDWTRSLGDMLRQGAVFLVDYGFPAHEYFHPQRATGTLMCHYRHHAHPDPFYLVGLQDITAHVDFTAIAKAAAGVGLHVAGFVNQAHFLIASGLLEELGQETGTRESLMRAADVKKLTLPSEMGELFKVLALTRGLETELMGFRQRDDRARL